MSFYDLRSADELKENAIAWLERLSDHGGNGAPKNGLFLKKAADVLADTVRELAKRANNSDEHGALLDWLDKPHHTQAWAGLAKFLPEHFQKNPYEQAEARFNALRDAGDEMLKAGLELLRTSDAEIARLTREGERKSAYIAELEAAIYAQMAETVRLADQRSGLADHLNKRIAECEEREAEVFRLNEQLGRAMSAAEEAIKIGQVAAVGWEASKTEAGRYRSTLELFRQIVGISIEELGEFDDVDPEPVMAVLLDDGELTIFTDGSGQFVPYVKTCPKCGNDLHGFRGPLCRYCDPDAYTE